MYNKYTCVELMLIGRRRIDKGDMRHSIETEKTFSDEADTDHQTIRQLVLQWAMKED